MPGHLNMGVVRILGTPNWSELWSPCEYVLFIELLDGSVSQSAHESDFLIPLVAIARDDAITCETW